jgi:hypothetical protein
MIVIKALRRRAGTRQGVKRLRCVIMPATNEHVWCQNYERNPLQIGLSRVSSLYAAWSRFQMSELGTDCTLPASDRKLPEGGNTKNLPGNWTRCVSLRTNA